jgi:hypothetical protein
LHSEVPGPAWPHFALVSSPNMPTDVFIYSKAPLKDARGALEDDIESFLGPSGEVTGGGGGASGWNVDLELSEIASGELVRPREFLVEWGVPRDTFLRVVPRTAGEQPYEILVYDRAL